MNTTAKETKETDLTKKHNASRYLTMLNEGNECYTENISIKGSIADYAPMVAERIRLAEKAMPHGTWSATIEQQWTERTRGALRVTKHESRHIDRDRNLGEVEQTEFAR